METQQTNWTQARYRGERNLGDPDVCDKRRLGGGSKEAEALSRRTPIGERSSKILNYSVQNLRVVPFHTLWPVFLPAMHQS